MFHLQKKPNKKSCPICGALVHRVVRHLTQVHRQSTTKAKEKYKEQVEELKKKSGGELLMCEFCGEHKKLLTKHMYRVHREVAKKKRLKAVRKARGKDVSDTDDEEELESHDFNPSLKKQSVTTKGKDASDTDDQEEFQTLDFNPALKKRSVARRIAEDFTSSEEDEDDYPDSPELFSYESYGSDLAEDDERQDEKRGASEEEVEMEVVQEAGNQADAGEVELISEPDNMAQETSATGQESSATETKGVELEKDTEKGTAAEKGKNTGEAAEETGREARERPSTSRQSSGLTPFVSSINQRFRDWLQTNEGGSLDKENASEHSRKIRRMLAYSTERVRDLVDRQKINHIFTTMPRERNFKPGTSASYISTYQMFLRYMVLEGIISVAEQEKAFACLNGIKSTVYKKKES